MNYSRIIEIDIWSSFGCFTKPFSNSGGFLTFLIPPKTSIIGIIGAVLGCDVNNFTESESVKKYEIEKFNDIKVSIQPLFELKTKRVTFNNSVSYNKLKNINQDILINPYYKLFITFPKSLFDEEELFINRISENRTVYNLYMGRNEFPLNYNLIRVFDYNEFNLDENNSKEFFKSNKVYGSLNRSLIKSTSLESEDSSNNSILKLLNRSSTSRLGSFYEYVIKDFPIKRENFVDFTYSKVSFYTIHNHKDCYFKEIILNKGEKLELSTIEDKKWISWI